MASTTILSDNGASSGSAGIKTTGGNDGVLILQTTTSGGTATTAVTLDNNQNMGVGITSIPNYSSNLRTVSFSNTSGVVHDYCVNGTRTGSFVCQSSGFDLTTQTAIPLVFSTNATERARIDSSGKMIVGQSSTTINGSYSPTLGSVVTATTGQAASFGATSGSYTGSMLVTSSITSGSTSWSHAYGAYGNGSSITTDAYYIYGNGNIVNRNNSYGAISDIKLKENIVDATPKLSQLCQVRVVNYNFIGDEHKQLGVIAQEVEQVFPNIIEESPDYETVTTTDEDGNETTERVATGATTKQVKYSVFVPMLIKAMQEQQAIITQLQADVAALKGAQA